MQLSGEINKASNMIYSNSQAAFHKVCNKTSAFQVVSVRSWLCVKIHLIQLSLRADSALPSRPARLDCVKASEHCLKEYSCSTKYRTMRQCVAGRESNFTAVTGPEAQGECRSAIDAMKQSPLYNCRCRRGMKKEKNCLRIFWSIFQSLQGRKVRWRRGACGTLEKDFIT